MHVVDHVQCINIQLGQPLHHFIIFSKYFIVIKVLRSNWLVSRSYLYFSLFINTTVDSVKKTLSKVSTSSEELHLFTCLCSRYTAADAVVISPYRTHNIIVLVLDGACCYRNQGCELLKVLWQS